MLEHGPGSATLETPAHITTAFRPEAPLPISDSLRSTFLPALLAVGGALVIGSVLSASPDALSMDVRMQGCFAVGVVGFLLARLHGLSFPRALFAMTPVFGVQAWGFTHFGLPILPPLALEVMVLGLVGLVPTTREETDISHS